MILETKIAAAGWLFFAAAGGGLLGILDGGSVQMWLAFVTGSGGATVLAILWVRTTLQDKKALIEILRTKDHELVEITRESIRCIEASLSRADLESGFRTRLETLLSRIERRLESMEDRKP